MDVQVASLALAVHENLELHKNRIQPLPGQDSGKRICIVTGIHGDELEGQYVAFLLNRRLQEHPEYLHATVDIYPAINPMGINTIQRGVPLFDLDMNRIFPGESDGPAAEFLAQKIIQDVTGADIAIDIHASNIFLRELPQVRISEETGGPAGAFGQAAEHRFCLDSRSSHGASQHLCSQHEHPGHALSGGGDGSRNAANPLCTVNSSPRASST